MQTEYYKYKLVKKLSKSSESRKETESRNSVSIVSIPTTWISQGYTLKENCNSAVNTSVLVHEY